MAIESIPRFGLVGVDDAAIAARLASLGWTPTVTAATLDALDLISLRRCDVIAVICEPEQLSDPAVQAEAARVATPLVAIVKRSMTSAVVDAARLGWRGYVDAEKSTPVIARTISMVARGQLSFPASAAGALARALASFAPVRSLATSELTPRQRQIVALLAQGATDAEIAATLGISLSTAHKHVQNARRRLRARTRSQLVAATQAPVVRTLKAAER